MMNHIIEHGIQERIIIMLHGTGGDAKSMITLARLIDDQATLIGIEGDVFEQGMRRYFKRYSDGTFDLISLEEKTKQLYEEIQRLLKKYSLTNSKVTLIGYSNGANIAINLFKEFETDIDCALLLHPALGRGDVEFMNQKQLSLFLSTGENDPYISEGEFNQLIKQLDHSRINYSFIRHKHGHRITEEEIRQAKQFYQQTIEDK